MDVFKNRVNDYMYAIQKYPYVMNEEYENIYQELQLCENDILLNIDGVAVPFDQYIKNKPIHIDYQLIESNIHFANYAYLTPFLYSNIPFEDHSINKAFIHASLHHVNIEDRITLYKEVYRVLKEDGIFIVTDVMKYSKEDYWLNTIVNEYNPNGHNGLFFDISDIYDMKSVGFKVSIKDKKYSWVFKNKIELIDFVKKMFYMKKECDDAKIYNLVEKYLKIIYDKESKLYYFEWSLLYFICKKI